MTYEDQLSYLLEDGNLRVPGSRYGWDSQSCAPAAIAVADIIAAESGDPVTEELLDHVMSLVVNDYDGPLELLVEHGAEHGYDWRDYV